MCSTVQEQITTCGQNAIVKIGERTNIRPQTLGQFENLVFVIMSTRKNTPPLSLEILSHVHAMQT